ncbi:ABC transporter substrate-binding protein [Janthinobacterium sp.]|uniref:ABC transporter substrate-binding protein n=1 Tax=Janthinobacterium sp. TaxID=1871054 RepID=UPI00293D4A57|nr:ABC transporter substrate-binding protein [Janthinobacterium sp.]
MHPRFTTAVLAAALAAGALSAAPAQADQIAAIKAKGELVCGVLGTDEPNSFVDPKSRQIVGYEVDLCNAVARKLGVKPAIKQLAVAARIPELQQGRVDILAASLTHNKEREALVDFSLSTFITGQKVLVKRSSNIVALAGLAGKKVLTVKGGTQEPNIRKAVPSVEVVTYETTVQAYLALQQGKGAGYVDDESSLLNNYAKLGAAQKDYLVLAQSLSTEALALGIRKGETGLKGLVDNVLRELEQSGEGEKLFFKWYGPNSNLKFEKRTFKFDSDKVEA